MVAAFVGLGSNLADPVFQLQRACLRLDALPQTRLEAASRLYRSAPVGYLEQPDFVNAVVRLETELSAPQLLKHLLQLEHLQGRERKRLYGPRTLDLDILLYQQQTIQCPGLTVPHPHMHRRAFVLKPLLDIAPHQTIPGQGEAERLLSRLTEQQIEPMPGQLWPVPASVNRA